MKNAVLLALALTLTACSRFAPDAGHEIVLVKKPWFFGHGGVDPDPVKAGLSYGAISTEGVDVDMQPQKFEADMPDTMTSDGVPISFHAIMMLQVVDSVALVKNFGPNWYENNLEQPFATMVRQAVRKRGMNETAIKTTALDDIDAEIRQALIDFIKDKAIPIKLVTAISKSQDKGYGTLLQPEFITECNCRLSGDKATGSVKFHAKGLYHGKAEFTARQRDGSWRIEEFRLPAYGLQVNLGDDGKWKKSDLVD